MIVNIHTSSVSDEVTENVAKFRMTVMKWPVGLSGNLTFTWTQ